LSLPQRLLANTAEGTCQDVRALQ